MTRPVADVELQASAHDATETAAKVGRGGCVDVPRLVDSSPAATVVSHRPPLHKKCQTRSGAQYLGNCHISAKLSDSLQKRFVRQSVKLLFTRTMSGPFSFPSYVSPPLPVTLPHHTNRRVSLGLPPPSFSLVLPTYARHCHLPYIPLPGSLVGPEMATPYNPLS